MFTSELNPKEFGLNVLTLLTATTCPHYCPLPPAATIQAFTHKHIDALDADTSSVIFLSHSLNNSDQTAFGFI